MVISATELRQRKQYWKRVSMCLVAFHKFQPAKADEKVAELQKRFPLKSTSPVVELIYHEEPFRLACKLVNSKMSVKSHSRKYQEILDSTGETPEVRKTEAYRTVSEKLRSRMKSQLKVQEKADEPEKARKDLPAAAAAGTGGKKSAKRRKDALSVSKAVNAKKLEKKPVIKKTEKLAKDQRTSK
jgi:hypothetical protein